MSSYNSFQVLAFEGSRNSAKRARKKRSAAKASNDNDKQQQQQQQGNHGSGQQSEQTNVEQYLELFEDEPYLEEYNGQLDVAYSRSNAHSVSGKAAVQGPDNALSGPYVASASDTQASWRATASAAQPVHPQSPPSLKQVHEPPTPPQPQEEFPALPATQPRMRVGAKPADHHHSRPRHHHIDPHSKVKVLVHAARKSSARVSSASATTPAPELQHEGLRLLQDQLEDEDAFLDSRSAAAKQAILAREHSRQQQGGGAEQAEPVLRGQQGDRGGGGSSGGGGISQDNMLVMMEKAAQRKQRQHGGGPSDQSSDSSTALPEYNTKTDAREYRAQIDSMLRNGWEPVKRGAGGGGKHLKFRRVLADGTLQTIIMPCSPSDSLRGILNLQAQLSRQDRAATEAQARLVAPPPSTSAASAGGGAAGAKGAAGPGAGAKGAAGSKGTGAAKGAGGATNGSKGTDNGTPGAAICHTLPRPHIPALQP